MPAASKSAADKTAAELQDARARIGELQRENADLKRAKKYGLVWEEKTEAVVKQCETEFPVLKELSEFAIHGQGNGGDCANPNADHLPTHIIIEGDNYHSLSVLNYTHANKIDVIYIDPPYNTGARDWKYNNDYVDREDGFRHSKWLSLIANRLRLAKNLLTDRGFICVAIDHNELFNLGNLMDEMFGEDNRCGVVTVVNKVEGRLDSKFFAPSNEFVLVYAKNAEVAVLHNIEMTAEKIAGFNKEDSVGKYKLKQLRRAGSNSNREDAKNMHFPIYYHEKTETFSLVKTAGAIKILPINPTGDEKVWRWGKELTEKKLADLVYKKTNGKHNIYLKARLEDYPGIPATTVWYNENGNSYSSSTAIGHLNAMLGRGKFAYPKSVYAVLDFLKITSHKDSVVLDFFAGSGTTGHAVSLLNKQDGGRRQFILCTNNENNNGDKTDPNKGIARGVCYPRIKAVLTGRDLAGQPFTGRLAEITGLPANLKYFTTDFVPAGNNDQDRYKLSAKAAEMLCIRENTFIKINATRQYKLFMGFARLTAVVLSDSGVASCKKAITAARKKYGDKVCVVYQFAVGAIDRDAFKDLPQVYPTPIPDEIRRIYDRVFGRKRK